ncbi:MAG: recombination mediator RecR [Atribacterota bacterium]|nr:recombination mediator RecR [Atribacterota bacterium]MDD4895604.1 recombination mediator RecR [Atribacterota bacterium]MDD5637260.1 recombination mediator RecR [Atribacterota bacterium]
MSYQYARPLAILIDELSKLPGIGPKTAQRLALYILNISREEAGVLAQSIINAKEKIKRCQICHNLTDQDICEICQEKTRQRDTICVVETARDLMALEKTGGYKGLYHVLLGAISPLDGVEPDHLTIDHLISRLKTEKITEIILATNPNIEGEVTASYIARLVRPLGIKVTRIAYGIPIGGDLEYADEVTLTQALIGRQIFKNEK